mmetsp:Transcript_37091/g.112132  ORF Transcript_37091/g.112132 Transcript_37091/m.112132 type:complete len:229 (-) Transcript_37091:517-1203(-)
MVLLRFFFCARSFFRCSSAASSFAFASAAAASAAVASAAVCCAAKAAAFARRRLSSSSSCFFMAILAHMAANMSFATASPFSSGSHCCGCSCKFCAFTNSWTSCISSRSPDSRAFSKARISGTWTFIFSSRSFSCCTSGITMSRSAQRAITRSMCSGSVATSAGPMACTMSASFSILLATFWISCSCGNRTGRRRISPSKGSSAAACSAIASGVLSLRMAVCSGPGPV